MVASDTVVGLIGAGVLVVALFGVFIIESKAAPEKENELDKKTYIGVASGQITTAADGGGVMNPVTNERTCPPAGAPGQCYGAFTNIDLTISNLPALPANGGIYYAVFLQASESTDFSSQFYGTLDAQGKFADNETEGAKKDGREADRLVVTLETTSSPAAPSRWVVFNQNLTSPGNAVARQPISGQTPALDLTMGGKADARLQEIDSSLQVTVTLESAHRFNMSEYRVWAIDNESGGMTASYVGNITGTGEHVSGSVTYGFPEAKFPRVDKVVVVLASTSQKAPNKGDSLAAGTQPDGVVLFEKTFD